MAYLRSLRRVTERQLETLIAGLQVEEETPRAETRPVAVPSSRAHFRILDYVTPRSVRRRCQRNSEENRMPKKLARLVLPKPLLRRLESAGVYCQTWVTVARQARANRWVLRGVGSGGGNREVGRYISFFSAEGNRLPWLQKLDRVTGNGVHAVVVAVELVSVEMARVEQTYQLAIIHHRLAEAASGERPQVVSSVVFRGIDGQLPPELLKDGLAPEFFTRGGEVKPIPAKFLEAVKLVTAAVGCSNCRHCHGLVEKPAAAAAAVDAAVATVSE
jgi:hypothetical protein